MIARTTHSQNLPEYVYIHYPVCKHVCSYCDFNVLSQKKIQEAHGSDFNSSWINGIKKHLKSLAGPADKKQKLKTLYLGGGTPSLVALPEIEKLLNILKQYYSFSDLEEFSIECNPETLNREYIEGLKALGINRPSIGVQTFLAPQLKRLERLATSKHIEDGIKIISEVFDNYSLDLMIGIPDQSHESLLKDLGFIKKFKPPHVSIYILTLDKNHKLKTHPAISDKLSSDEQVSNFYKEVCRTMKNEGYDHYEVSNFCLSGYQSKHNLNYWNPESDYLGLGPGAHGYFKTTPRQRYEMIRDPKAWFESDSGIGELEELDAEQQLLEEYYLKLRSRTAVPHQLFSSHDLTYLKDQSWVESSEEGIKLSEEGWLRLDSIAAQMRI
jgi:oxygen-independent coproporphyrinogen-3 oxidase